jgi:hypothetical protein
MNFDKLFNGDFQCGSECKIFGLDIPNLNDISRGLGISGPGGAEIAQKGQFSQLGNQNKFQAATSAQSLGQRRNDQRDVRDRGFSDFRGDQQGLIGMLRQESQAPGVGSALVDQAVNQNTAEEVSKQQGLAAQARGAQGALAARGAAQNVASIGANAGAAKVQGHLGVRQNAMNAIGQQVGIARQGDQANVAAKDSALAAQGGLENELIKNEAEGRRERERQNTSRFNAQTGSTGDPGAGGAIASAIGSVFSDRRLKSNVTSGESALRDLMRTTNPYEYDYKPGNGLKGRHVGVMAQDLEKSVIGRQMVTETGRGKMVNYGQGLSAMMAGLSLNDKRLAKLEGE